MGSKPEKKHRCCTAPRRRKVPIGPVAGWMGICSSVDTDELSFEEQAKMDAEEARQEARRRNVARRVRTKEVKMVKKGQIVGEENDEEPTHA